MAYGLCVLVHLRRYIQIRIITFTLVVHTGTVRYYYIGTIIMYEYPVGIIA